MHIKRLRSYAHKQTHTLSKKEGKNTVSNGKMGIIERHRLAFALDDYLTLHSFEYNSLIFIFPLLAHSFWRI